MNRTTTADPCFIPDIETFEKRLAIHIHDGGIPTDKAKDLAACSGLLQSGALLGVAQSLCREKKVGVEPRPKTKPASQSGGGAGYAFLFFVKKVGVGLVWQVLKTSISPRR